MQFNLIHHPATPPADPGFKVWASVEHSAAFGASATANFWFSVGAPASRFVIPHSDEPMRTDELWKTTCFEAFLRPSGGEAYREWNFAPSGDWATYDFTSRREGMGPADIGAPPYVRMEDNMTWWTVGATIAVNSAERYDLSLSVVLEEKDGTKSYWALTHCSDKPDFHAPDCFVARLP